MTFWRSLGRRLGFRHLPVVSSPPTPLHFVEGGALIAGALLLSCTAHKDLELGTQSFRIDVTSVNGIDPPTVDAPLPANTGKTEETWQVSIEAVGTDGKPESFDGYVRLSVQPGAVVSVVNDATGENIGKNLKLQGGKATATITVTAVYGETRLWVEDLGYVPTPAGKTPGCANGKNDDEEDDALVDFPNDPGCAFADDDTETAGQFAAGTSPPVHYALPSVMDVQGNGSTTPFPYESMQVNAAGKHELIVTRIAKDGFYVTDLSGQATGYNHLFAFNFSTPRGMRVCDRVTYLSGTVAEFFGFTELSFPSFDVQPLFEGDEANCKVPEPVVLGRDQIEDAITMEKLESGLVRIEGFTIPAFFGPKPAINNVFAEDQSSCDLNGDGRVDFESDAEASCANECNDNKDCTEWTSYIARGNYKVWKEETPGVPTLIQIQTDAAAELNPTAYRGQPLAAITGTMRNFSGGTLNWTVEARCVDDVICAYEGCALDPTALAEDPNTTVLATAPIGPQQACVDLRTIGDNDEGTN